MPRIRRAEEAIAELVETGEARCPCHLYIGQEAIAAGVCAALTTTTRSGAATVRTAIIWPRADRSKDCSPRFWEEPRDARGGRGGSMHLIAPEAGNPGDRADRRGDGSAGRGRGHGVQTARGELAWRWRFSATGRWKKGTCMNR